MHVGIAKTLEALSCGLRKIGQEFHRVNLASEHRNDGA